MRLVLAYEILFGQGIRCGGKSGVFAKENKQQLFELLEEFQNDGRYSEETAKNSFGKWRLSENLKSSFRDTILTHGSERYNDQSIPH